MPRRSTRSLTKRLIDGIDSVPGKDFTIWDKSVTGFGLRVKSSGIKSFVIKYRNDRSKQRKVTLGKYGALTVEQARKMAKTELGKVANGDDPAMEAKRQRQAATIGALCDQYFEEASAGNILSRGKPKKASTLAIDRGRIDRHIKPLLGNTRINELTRNDAENFMHQVRDGATIAFVKTNKHGRARVRGGPGTAKKALSLLSAIYSYAVRQGLADDNPCRYVERSADNKRHRFLNEAEYGQLGAVLKLAKRETQNALSLSAIEVLLLTGCRKSEILNLRRHEVDTNGRCLRLGDTKTGAQMRPCGEVALTILTKTLESHGSEWVFPAYRTDGPITNVRKQLIRLCEQAKLANVTPHVFRHSFATVAHEIGYSELTIAGLLGHHLSSVTSQYVHNVDHALADAADKVSTMVWGRLN